LPIFDSEIGKRITEYRNSGKRRRSGMFSEEDLQELVDFHSEELPVLSLYLDVDPTKHTTDEYKLVLRGLLKEVTGRAQRKDVSAVERYFDHEYDWQGKGVAVFSCLKQDFWRAYPLAVPVDNHVYVGERPYIKPLTDILDAYGRYGVVLVDQEGARLFLFRLGELQETNGTIGEEVKRMKHGRGSAAGRMGGRIARMGRKEEEIAQRNLKEAAELTAKFCAGGRCSRIILGGTEQNVALFQEMLPRELQEQVVGSFPAVMAASEAEVLDRSLEIIAEVEREREEELVESAITAAAKGGAGVIGLADTLGAMYEGRVHILLVDEGYKATGYRCQQCGYIAAQAQKKCPFCGGEVKEIDDAVDLIVREVLDQGGKVEVVRDNPALKGEGYIAALLRY
jgi:peptide subunit release factor 1 (eRF1)